MAVNIAMVRESLRGGQVELRSEDRATFDHAVAAVSMPETPIRAPFNMPTIYVIRSNPTIGDAELAAALVAGTSRQLAQDEAEALVRTVAHHAPTVVGGPAIHQTLSRIITTVLANSGYEVRYEAEVGGGSTQ